MKYAFLLLGLTCVHLSHAAEIKPEIQSYLNLAETKQLNHART